MQKKCLKCDKISAVKNGNLRGKNKLRCNLCSYQCVETNYLKRHMNTCFCCEELYQNYVLIFTFHIQS